MSNVQRLKSIPVEQKDRLSGFTSEIPFFELPIPHFRIYLHPSIQLG